MENFLKHTIVMAKTLTVAFAVLISFGNLYAASATSEDLRDLRSLAAWRASQESGSSGPDATPERLCGILNLSNYETQCLDQEVPSSLSDREATSQVEALDRKVVALLAERNWSKIDMGGPSKSIPDLTRCYRKQGAILQIFKTTGRCTMNLPCTAYDGFTVNSFLPKAKR